MNNTTTGKKARPRSFRLSDDEWAEIEKRATKAGISTSKWIRAALLDHLEMDGKKPQAQAVSMPQMPPEIRNIAYEIRSVTPKIYDIEAEINEALPKIAAIEDTLPKIATMAWEIHSMWALLNKDYEARGDMDALKWATELASKKYEN